MRIRFGTQFIGWLLIASILMSDFAYAMHDEYPPAGNFAGVTRSSGREDPTGVSDSTEAGCVADFNDQSRTNPSPPPAISDTATHPPSHPSDEPDSGKFAAAALGASSGNTSQQNATEDFAKKGKESLSQSRSSDESDFDESDPKNKKQNWGQWFRSKKLSKILFPAVVLAIFFLFYSADLYFRAPHAADPIAVARRTGGSLSKGSSTLAKESLLENPSSSDGRYADPLAQGLPGTDLGNMLGTKSFQTQLWGVVEHPESCSSQVSTLLGTVDAAVANTDSASALCVFQAEGEGMPWSGVCSRSGDVSFSQSGSCSGAKGDTTGTIDIGLLSSIRHPFAVVIQTDRRSVTVTPILSSTEVTPSLSETVELTRERDVSLSETGEVTPDKEVSLSAETKTIELTRERDVSLSAETKTVELTRERDVSLSAETKTVVLTPIKWVPTVPTKYNTSTSYFWEVVRANGTEGSPSSRCDGTVQAINGSLYAFGGTSTLPDATSVDNNVWIFNGSAWSIFTVSGTKPSARCCFGSTTNNSKLYIFGGVPGGNDLWELDIESREWTQLTPTGAVGSPSERYGAGSGIFENKLYIFGGRDISGNTIFSDIWEYNPSGWINKTPAVFPTRWYSSVINFNNTIGIFGGTTDLFVNFTNDLLNFNGLNLNVMSPDTAAPSSPERRAGAAMGSIGQEEIVIFGGYDSVGYNDLWIFDIAQSIWTKVIQNGIIPTARYFGSMLANIDDYLYLADGYDGSTTLNDLSRLRKILIGLYNITVSPNLIFANEPFNLSWRVNTTRGSDTHTAFIDFNGTTKLIQNVSNTLGWTMLTAPGGVGNSSIILRVSDDLDPNATTNATIPFTQTP